MAEPTTKPGDLVGHDSQGRVRIDRVIPLPWALSLLGAVVMQAVVLWFQVQAATETVREMKLQLTSMLSAQALAREHAAEKSAELRELRHRIEALEGRRP